MENSKLIYMFAKLKMKEKILFENFDTNKTYTSLISSLSIKPFKQQKEFKELVLFLEEKGFNVDIQKDGNKIKKLNFNFPFANELSCIKLFSDQYGELKYQVFKEIEKTLRELGLKNIEFNHFID